MKKCLYCKLLPKCPLNGRPVEELVLESFICEDRYSCEELVSLYLKFQEIGKYIKEEKENGRR